VFRAVRAHARHGLHQWRDDLNRFVLLLGGVWWFLGPWPVSAAGRAPVPGSGAATALRISSAATGSPQRLDRQAYPFAAVCGRR